jgi:hypothetical protein
MFRGDDMKRPMQVLMMAAAMVAVTGLSGID